MGGTANKFTPLWMPWREALKRAGSFDELRPFLHEGRIPVRHDGLYTLSDGKVHIGPGILGPEKWAVLHKDRAGRVIFFTEEVVFGRVVQEEVFAYAISIELDSVAFDTCFPVATLPPAAASVQWAIAATRALQAESKIPEGITKAELARLLETEAQKAVRAGKLRHALKASYLENQLAPWDIWPLSSFK